MWAQLATVACLPQTKTHFALVCGLITVLISLSSKDGYVVKTTDSSTGVKAFINVCSNQHIAKAWSQFVERKEDGKK